MKFKGKILVSGTLTNDEFYYQVLGNVLDFNQKVRAIIVSNLNPSYTLLLFSLDLIISERGSPLTHLATIAREYNKTIILSEKIRKFVSEKGKLRLFCNKKDIEIEIL